MADRSDEARDTRQGDILGLGGATPSRTDIPDNTVPSRPSRRHRAAEEEPMTESSDMPHGSGATGIDMGSGGEGTDIE